MRPRQPAHGALFGLAIGDALGAPTEFLRYAEIVQRCQAAGLVWGQELYIDATKMMANAAVDSIAPRFAVAARAHLDDLFAFDEGADGPPPPPAPALSEEPVCIGPSAEVAPDLPPLATEALIGPRP